MGSSDPAAPRPSGGSSILSDVRYHNLIEDAHPIVWSISARTLQPNYLSPEIEHLLKIPLSEWHQPGFWQRQIHPDDYQRIVDFMVAAAAGGSRQEIDYRIKTGEGKFLRLRTFVRLVERPGGDAELVGISFDQTSQRRADALLVGDLKILEMIAGGLPLGEILRELVLMIEGLAEGMKGSVLLLEDGKRVRHAASPSLPPEFAKAIDGEEIGPDRGSCGTAAFRRETVIVEDIAIDPLWTRYRDGALAFGLRACWSVPILAQDRTTVLGTFALYYLQPRRLSPELLELCRHASSLASVAIERDRRIEALRASEERLSLISEHVEDVLFHLRIEPGGVYRFLSVNPAFSRSTGIEAARIVGKSVKDVIPEPSASLVLGKYAEAIRTRKTVRWEETTTYPTGTRTGEVAITPVCDAGGVPQFLVGSVRDLTERRKLEENVRQLQKMDAIGRLTGGVAHDFNNLLTVILGYGEIFLADLPKGSPQRADVQEILNAGNRAAALTRQLLAFARKQALQPLVLDLNAVVRGMEKMLRRLIQENIAFDLSLESDLWPVLADPGQIEQVILNLAVNARDAVGPGGRITFETKNVDLDADYAQSRSDVIPGPYAMLAISDNGCGMTREVQARIFEPFFTTKEQGKGTGLGLATVYGIVRQSGGHIFVYSEPGRGSSFKIYLPRAKGATALLRAAVSQPASRPGSEEILVVEDESGLRSLCARILKHHRYRVHVAEHAEAALTLLHAGLRPDLLVTDLVMQGMDGFQLAEQARGTHPKMKILFMSGYTERTMDEGGGFPHGGLFLQKPFSAEALARAVRQVLDT